MIVEDADPRAVDPVATIRAALALLERINAAGLPGRDLPNSPATFLGDARGGLGACLRELTAYRTGERPSSSEQRWRRAQRRKAR